MAEVGSLLGDLAASGTLAVLPVPKMLTFLFLGSLFLLILVIGLSNHRVLLVMGFTLYSAQMFNAAVLPRANTVYAVMALASVGLVAMLRGRMPRFEVLRGGAFPATFIYLVLGVGLITGSIDPGNTMNSVASILYAVGFAWTVLSACDADEILLGIRRSMGLIIAVSLLLIVVMPSAAVGGYELEIVADRWRGLTENPNALSTFAAVYFLTATTATSALLSAVPTLAIMVGTASRASAFALAVVAGPRLLQASSRLARRIVLVLAIAAAVPVMYSVFFTENTAPVDITNQSLIRTTNTRADLWGGAVTSIRDNLWTGVGIGNDFKVVSEMIPVSSSVLRPIVEIGTPALVPLALIAVLGVRAMKGAESPFRPMFAFLVIHGMFEGWIFAGGSMIFVLFLISAWLMDQARMEAEMDRNDSVETEAATSVPGDLSVAAAGRP